MSDKETIEQLRMKVEELEDEQPRQLGQMMAISNACSGGSQDVSEGNPDWSPQLDLVRYLAGTVEELEARLRRHECIEHDPPKFGECDECDSHDPDESWKNVEP